MYGSRPLSRLESALYVIVVSVLMLVLLDRMLAYFEYAERAAVQTTLLNTEAALDLRLAYDVMRGAAPDREAWSAHNPFEQAKMMVPNYAGERVAPDARLLEDGKWVYDRAAHQLIYVPRFNRGLSIEGGGAALRFRLSVGAPDGIPRLVPVARYRWEP